MRGGANQQLSVLGFPLDAVALDAASAWILARIASGERGSLVVTLNPEIVVQALKDERLAEAIRAAELSVADGVGVAWAARHQGVALPGRVPGVDLAQRVMLEGGPNLRVYFLGAKPGIAERAAAESAKSFGVQVAGFHHGYFDKASDAGTVSELVRASRADLLLAGLGEGQELFLYENAAQLDAAVMIGVGGTLDVLAGEVKRMPQWTSRLGVEWLFRVAGDRRRWGRFPRLVDFAIRVLRNSPKG